MSVIDKFVATIATHGSLLIGTSPKSRMVSVSALLLAACAFGAAGVAPHAPNPDELKVISIVEELGIPDLAEQVAALEPVNQRFIVEEQVLRGDTLATVLNRMGVRDDAAVQFMKTDRVARQLLNLRAGKLVQAEIAGDGSLQWIKTIVAVGNGNEPVKNIVVSRKDDGFFASEVDAPIEKRVEMRTGQIYSSLFAATDTAQVPDAVAMQLVDIFSSDIDFARDLRRGDRFNVVYETYWQDGEYVRTGRVLAAEFHNAGDTYQAVWFQEPGSSNGGGYYGFDGKSLKKAFLKSPLEFSRITSGFSMRRHPISGKWKAHKGVDFGAPTGTPIRATGNGTIDYMGYNGGYGNLVIIKHSVENSTAYAHMSRFAKGLRKGSKVSQGQVIGYVGSTGWSTGPHLHYEFRVRGVTRDPMSIKIANNNAPALTGPQKERFRSVADEMAHRFALLSTQQRGLKLAAH
jgi:murein DD-endopeptidase MepM/ murein hydrolase activator NlpD